MSNVVPFTPGLMPATITEGEVTIARLSDLLDTVFIDHDIDDEGDIYITDGVDFPVWVQIDGARKYLVLFTYCRVDEPTANWLARVNEMNSKVMLSQFYYCKNAILGSHWITYDGSLNVRQFVKLLRRFSGAFRAGIESHNLERAGSASVLTGSGPVGESCDD